MNIFLWVMAVYVISVIIMRFLIRKLSVINGDPPDATELVINFIPIFNTISIPVIIIEIIQRKSKRTFVEVFYGIKKDEGR
ncbi:hypothetical protein I2483_13885 [Sporosarcina sp. E16_3]|uniref:hypothetical protein n=1 Tax=Sporosarcina sp. E16_3 TaxID=2789293 RepID=UPI001A926FEA|nr:hypothetical protein [Sporosarcina sp. E16_3]MBO0602754.1 hypothetical protein [Sporosarcina sp. E16_3]